MSLRVVPYEHRGVPTNDVRGPRATQVLYLEGLEPKTQLDTTPILFLSLGTTFHFVSYRSWGLPVFASVVARLWIELWGNRRHHPKRCTVWLRATTVKYLAQTPQEVRVFGATDLSDPTCSTGGDNHPDIPCDSFFRRRHVSTADVAGMLACLTRSGDPPIRHPLAIYMRTCQSSCPHLVLSARTYGVSQLSRGWPDQQGDRRSFGRVSSSDSHSWFQLVQRRLVTEPQIPQILHVALDTRAQRFGGKWGAYPSTLLRACPCARYNCNAWNGPQSKRQSYMNSTTVRVLSVLLRFASIPAHGPCGQCDTRTYTTSWNCHALWKHELEDETQGPNCYQRVPVTHNVPNHARHHTSITKTLREKACFGQKSWEDLT
ncbi:hypothetical protein EDB92DRAFT_1976939 [Lactarius akahatsu]|uniref:Uncharacterized protein n=1 Tax=Lactarius akahatsu TaxID=416441 RepID=A0AAD4LIT4_9AGAM|nr:hypothetical protein EDB92DRAFT_1976939 [Lactarius akahatsu]